MYPQILSIFIVIEDHNVRLHIHGRSKMSSRIYRKNIYLYSSLYLNIVFLRTTLPDLSCFFTKQLKNDIEFATNY